MFDIGPMDGFVALGVWGIVVLIIFSLSAADYFLRRRKER